MIEIGKYYKARNGTIYGPMAQSSIREDAVIAIDHYRRLAWFKSSGERVSEQSRSADDAQFDLVAVHIDSVTQDFTPPTRYEMLIAASRQLQTQSFLAARSDQSQEVLRKALTDLQDVLNDIQEYELQMLGLWRLGRVKEVTPDA